MNIEDFDQGYLLGKKPDETISKYCRRLQLGIVQKDNGKYALICLDSIKDYRKHYHQNILINLQLTERKRDER